MICKGLPVTKGSTKFLGTIFKTILYHESEKLISETYSSAERDIYIQRVSKIFEVDVKSIKSDVDRIIARAAYARKKEESQKVKQDAIGYSDRVNPDFVKAPAVAKNEEALLGLLLLYPEHRKKVFEEQLVSEDDLFTELHRRVFAYLKDAYFEREDSHTDMNEFFSADETGRITRMKLSRMGLTENGTEVLLDSISTLKNSVRKKKAEKNSSLESLEKLLTDKRKN